MRIQGMLFLDGFWLLARCDIDPKIASIILTLLSSPLLNPLFFYIELGTVIYNYWERLALATPDISAIQLYYSSVDYTLSQNMRVFIGVQTRGV